LSGERGHPEPVERGSTVARLARLARLSQVAGRFGYELVLFGQLSFETKQKRGISNAT
jgi:hypothetical protein